MVKRIPSEARDSPREIMFEGKKVYVTGGRTGFLGANLVKVLLERGAKVYAHSHNSGKPSYFPKTPNLKQKTGSVCQIPQGTNYVFHCAAHTSGAYEMVHDPAAQVNENIILNSHVVSAAAKARVEKFVFISSSAIYPEYNRPLREEDGFKDDPPPSYFGPAWMKRYSEKLCEFYSKRGGLQTLVIRPSNVYGPYSSFDLQYSHVLPALIRKFVSGIDPLKVWGTDDVKRDFIYVEDFIEGVLKAFETFKGHNVYNIATGSCVTIREAVNLLAEITNYKGEIFYDASQPTTIHTREIDTTKAERELGFKAFTPFKLGLERTVNWYKTNVDS